MIPKIIHYCWFGRGEKPGLAKKCIRSWEKHCPDYRIIEWNEDNYDIAAAPLFVRQAMEARQWAFATDYVRYQVVYEYGGIYLDTDVELLQSPDALLRDAAFFGFQLTWGQTRVGSGLGFGAEKGMDFILELMGVYQQSAFLQPDGSVDRTANTFREENVFLAHGLRNDGSEQYLDGRIHIYPPAVFAPFDYSTGKLKKTSGTVSIHWYGFSWGTKEKKREYVRHRLYYRLCAPLRLLKRVVGQEHFYQMKKRLGRNQ